MVNLFRSVSWVMYAAGLLMKPECDTRVTLSAAHHALLTLALQDVNGVLNIMISTAASLWECRMHDGPIDLSLSLSLSGQKIKEYRVLGRLFTLYKVCGNLKTDR